MIPSLLTDSVTFNLDRALHYTLHWGLEGVALRYLGGPEDRVPFVNEAKLSRRLKEAEIAPVSVSPGVFEGAVADTSSWMNDVASFDEIGHFCRRIGCRTVVISAFSDNTEHDHQAAVRAMTLLGDRAARYGITAAILNEADTPYPTGTALAGLLADVRHANVGAAWQPAAALRAGESETVGCRALEPYLRVVRCSDHRFDGDAWQRTPVGDGRLDWRTIVKALAAAGFDGPLELEAASVASGLHEAHRVITWIREAYRGRS